MNAIQRELVVEIRKRMEEDLTKSAAGYSHFAENTISRLQQAYLKKYHSRPSHILTLLRTLRITGREESSQLLLVVSKELYEKLSSLLLKTVSSISAIYLLAQSTRLDILISVR